MKIYQVTQTTLSDNSTKNRGHILADSFDEAKRSFGMEIYENLLNGKYGDGYTYIDDYISEDEALQNPHWYTEPGVYDMSYMIPELILADSQLREGIESFIDDGVKYEVTQIAHESVNAYINQ